MLKMDYQDKLSRFNVLSLTSVFHLFSGAARRSLASHIMGDRISDSGEFISSARKDNMQHNIEIGETTSNFSSGFNLFNVLGILQPGCAGKFVFL